MNKIIVIGRLTKDVETRQANGKNISKFTLAVDRKYKQEGGQNTDFLSVVAFGSTSDFVSKYFKKGMKVVVEGRLQTGSYEKDGVKHYTTDIVAESVEFAESKRAEMREENNEWLDVPEGIENDLPFE